jgi:hypothetical protein
MQEKLMEIGSYNSNNEKAISSFKEFQSINSIV